MQQQLLSLESQKMNSKYQVATISQSFDGGLDILLRILLEDL